MQVHPYSPSRMGAGLSSLHALNDYGQERFRPLEGFRIREIEVPLTTIDEVLSEQSLRPTIVFFAKTGLALLAVLKGEQYAAEKH